jgi:hypothetical protein
MTTTAFSHFARPKRFKRLQIALMTVPLLSLLGLTACVAAPKNSGRQPAFELQSSKGLAGVNIRMALPNRTDSESQRLITAGMLQAVPGATLVAPLAGPFPARHFVWHVDYNVPNGTSRLVLNQFEGSKAVAYVQENIDADASNQELLAAIEAMSSRLYMQGAEQDAVQRTD